jgi:hypothetical protein
MMRGPEAGEFSLADYRLRHPITSCRIDRDLLKEIEDYLMARANEYGGTPILPTFAPKCTITFEEGRGRTATFQGVGEIPPGRFDDSVKQISLEVKFLSAQTFTPAAAKMMFDVNRWDSKLDISLGGPNPREKVIAMDSELQRILNRNKTLHWLFRPTALGLFFIVLAVVVPASLLASARTVTVLDYLLLVPLFAWVVYAVCGSLRRFSRVDTALNATQDTLFVLFWKLLGTLIAATGLIGFFARQWLGI